MRSKQCKDHYLDQQLCWAFHRYAVGEVWDIKGGLRSFAKVIYANKFCKALSVREWHTSSSPKEYVSGVLLCHERSLGQLTLTKSEKLKAWCLY